MHDDLWSNQSAALLQRDAFRNDETVRHCSGRGRGSGVGADAFSTRMPVATLPRKRKPDSFPFQVYLEDVSRETPHGVPSKRNVQSYENVDGKTKKQKKQEQRKKAKVESETMAARARTADPTTATLAATRQAALRFTCASSGAQIVCPIGPSTHPTPGREYETCSKRRVLDEFVTQGSRSEVSHNQFSPREEKKEEEYVWKPSRLPCLLSSQFLLFSVRHALMTLKQ